MIHILVGTNRPQSRSLEVARYIQPFYEQQGYEVKIMNLQEVGLEDLRSESYGDHKPEKIKQAVDELLTSEGLVVIVPEYNGSMPGALKYFIDHWKYPDSFEYRPVAFIGLGGIFGGLRPVEHLQQVFGYRNGFIFPDRVFLMNIWSILKEGQITDKTAADLLMKQAQGFGRFIKALKSENLHGGLKNSEK
jgi:chromate reductase